MAILCAVKATPVAIGAVHDCAQQTRRCRTAIERDTAWIVCVSENGSLACIGIPDEHYTDNYALLNKPEISEEDFLTALT